MTAHYTIVADKPRATLRVTMWGFFGAADVDAFARDLTLSLAELDVAPNAHKMLCDLREMKIQPQDTVAAFGAVVGSAAFRSRRLAVVIGKSLVRKQAMRLIDREDVSYFDSVQPAEYWLIEGMRGDAAMWRDSVDQLSRGFR